MALPSPASHHQTPACVCHLHSDMTKHAHLPPPPAWGCSSCRPSFPPGAETCAIVNEWEGVGGSIKCVVGRRAMMDRRSKSCKLLCIQSRRLALGLGPRKQQQEPPRPADRGRLEGHSTKPSDQTPSPSLQASTCRKGVLAGTKKLMGGGREPTSIQLPLTATTASRWCESRPTQLASLPDCV